MRASERLFLKDEEDADCINRQQSCLVGYCILMGVKRW